MLSETRERALQNIYNDLVYIQNMNGHRRSIKQRGAENSYKKLWEANEGETEKEWPEQNKTFHRLNS